VAGVPPSARHLEVESRLTELLAEADLPAPDRVEHEDDSVVFFWDGPRVAICVDLDREECEAIEPFDGRWIRGP
jgi:hypothetical protein